MKKYGKNVLFVLGIAAMGLIAHYQSQKMKALSQGKESVMESSAKEYIDKRKIQVKKED